MQGLGPTRDGSESEAGRITPEETELLRRMLFAPGSERPAGVSKAEAELLFRIKDGTLDGANAADWPQLFVQGVGNFLQGFDGHEPLSAERAVELEAFMNDTGGHIRDFLGRVLQSDPRDGFANLMSIMPHADTGDFDEEVEEAMQITPQERSWLNDMLEADEDLDPLEKQLLGFIAETQDLF